MWWCVARMGVHSFLYQCCSASWEPSLTGSIWLQRLLFAGSVLDSELNPIPWFPFSKTGHGQCGGLGWKCGVVEIKHTTLDWGLDTSLWKSLWQPFLPPLGIPFWPSCSLDIHHVVLPFSSPIPTSYLNPPHFILESYHALHYWLTQYTCTSSNTGMYQLLENNWNMRGKGCVMQEGTLLP